ncbi:TetR/AcrR family transcriptional regulator [Massilia endophytica]|uniref:TetR/AcrR family transcriptional regulator n=1 Tax=Massilia endophytica TaxID=2899220 RepID=UPI001E3A4473|nr:CerR family C-terminal domain-containing protein [Massilia endophytica]UGQ47165.1 CerR family C-terminal domain-containing protein [Massilia endophytica]
MSRPLRKSTAPSRTSRQDGDATRQQLLDVAGCVFAERGFADATSKEICARAGVNLAAVNYHFGSRDQLYEAVLVEAHHHLIKLEDMQAVAASEEAPRAKLRTILTRIVQRAAAPDAHWGARVVIRELLAPTPFAPALVHKAIAPKAKVMLGIVSQILGLPPDSPGLQRGLFFVMSPCLALLMAPPAMRQNVFPSLSDADGVVEDMLRYADAGLAALAAQYRKG